MNLPSTTFPYLIQRSGDIWIVELSETITLDDVERLMQELTSEQAQYRMWLVPRAIALTPEHVRQISIFANSQAFRSQVTAVVCPHDATFGIGRMFESLAEADGRKLRVFRDREEALSWLKSVREWNLGA